MKRPYVRIATDWCDVVLKDWAQQVKTRPRESVVVSPGQGIPTNFYEGGTLTGKETALATATRALMTGDEPKGYLVRGLTGKAAIADRVVLRIAGVDARCAWVLRGEYGLIPEIEHSEDTKARALHLGIYLDGHAWPASAYSDRLNRALAMFAVGYLCAL